MSQDQLDTITVDVEKMKNKYWGNNKIILHSRDIRKHQNGFEKLFDVDIKQEFYATINNILGQNIYTIICCAILKEPFIRQFGKMNDIYALSLSFMIERTVFYLDEVLDKDIDLHVIIERRGKREDKNLLDYYNKLRDTGTYHVSPERIKSYFKKFEMKWKKDDIVGLQIADLIAYPITRHILDPKSINYSFDTIKNNIFSANGKLYGLKVFPVDIQKKESSNDNPFPTRDTPIL